MSRYPSSAPRLVAYKDGADKLDAMASTLGVTSLQGFQYRALARSPSNMVNAIHRIITADPRITEFLVPDANQAGTHLINSHVIRYNINSEPQPPVVITSGYATTIPEATPVNQVTIGTAGVRVTGQISRDLTRNFSVDGALNTHYVSGLIPVQLGTPAQMNQLCLQIASATIDSGVTIVDNTYLYAKLLHYYLLKGVYNAYNILPDEAPFNADQNAFQWINCTEAQQFTVPVIRTAISQGDFTVWQTWGFIPTDISMWRLLGYAGCYFSSPAGIQIVPSSFYAWESIRFTAILPFIQPAAPVGGITQDMIWNFTLRLANSRNEQDHFTSGWYIASELVFGSALPYELCRDEEQRPFNEAMEDEEAAPEIPVEPRDFADIAARIRKAIVAQERVKCKLIISTLLLLLIMKPSEFCGNADWKFARHNCDKRLEACVFNHIMPNAAT